MTAIRWVLHIGLHKTGTSALQNRFAAGRALLAGEGILFPATGFGHLRHPTSPTATQGHNLFAHAIRDGDAAKFSRLLRELAQERHGVRAPTVLLSSELFSAPICADAPAWWRRAIPARDEVLVVTFLRRQDHWIESYYKEMLGWGGVRETRAIGEFIAAEGDALLDYAARLAPWAKAFGAEALRTFSYDDVMAGPGLPATLLALLGRPSLAGQLAPPGEQSNPSLDGRLVELLLTRNREQHLDRAAKKQLTARLLAWRAEPDSEASPRCSILTHGQRCELADRYREGNRQLAQTWLQDPAPRFQFPEEVEMIPLCRQLDAAAAGLS